MFKVAIRAYCNGKSFYETMTTGHDRIQEHRVSRWIDLDDLIDLVAQRYVVSRRVLLPK
ncbi:hypothetical protein JXQ70_12260 [bacterium]|nr:hypothetical protein [bacterium]